MALGTTGLVARSATVTRQTVVECAEAQWPCRAICIAVGVDWCEKSVTGASVQVSIAAGERDCSLGCFWGPRELGMVVPFCLRRRLFFIAFIGCGDVYGSGQVSSSEKRCTCAEGVMMVGMVSPPLVGSGGEASLPVRNRRHKGVGVRWQW